MKDKASINKIIAQHYNVKRPNRIQREAEAKIKSQIKLSSSAIDIKPQKKPQKKDFFAPMNNFISLSNNILDVPNLYKYKMIPGHSLETSQKVINRLTRNVYFSNKSKKEEILNEKLNKYCNPVTKIKGEKKSLSFEFSQKNQSFEILNYTCDKLIKDNKNCLKYFYRKKKVLNREVRCTQNFVDRVKKVKDNKEAQEFSNRLSECHGLLTKLNLIHPKNKIFFGNYVVD